MPSSGLPVHEATRTAPASARARCGAPYPAKVGSDGSAHHEKAQVDQKSDEEDLQGRFSRSQGLKGGKLSRRSKDQSRHENDLSQVEAVGLGGNPKSEGC